MDALVRDGDLLIEDGDLAVGFSDRQEQELLILSDYLSWKQNPLDGVGLRRYLRKAGGDDELFRGIRIALQEDGFEVEEIGRDASGNLYVNAAR